MIYTDVVLIENTMTIWDLLYSLQGLLVIVVGLLQYSIIYYACFLAYVDCYLAKQFHWPKSFDRLTLATITTIFLLVTFKEMFNSITNTIRQLLGPNNDRKIIVDVLDDPSKTFY